MILPVCHPLSIIQSLVQVGTIFPLKLRAENETENIILEARCLKIDDIGCYSLAESSITL